jgi:hypothetical protein
MQKTIVTTLNKLLELHHPYPFKVIEKENTVLVSSYRECLHIIRKVTKPTNVKLYGDGCMEHFSTHQEMGSDIDVFNYKIVILK